MASVSNSTFGQLPYANYEHRSFVDHVLANAPKGPRRDHPQEKDGDVFITGYRIPTQISSTGGIQRKFDRYAPQFSQYRSNSRAPGREYHGHKRFAGNYDAKNKHFNRQNEFLESERRERFGDRQNRQQNQTQNQRQPRDFRTQNYRRTRARFPRSNVNRDVMSWSDRHYRPNYQNNNGNRARNNSRDRNRYYNTVNNNRFRYERGSRNAPYERKTANQRYDVRQSSSASTVGDFDDTRSERGSSFAPSRASSVMSNRTPFSRRTTIDDEDWWAESRHQSNDNSRVNGHRGNRTNDRNDNPEAALKAFAKRTDLMLDSVGGEHKDALKAKVWEAYHDSLGRLGGRVVSSNGGNASRRRGWVSTGGLYNHAKDNRNNGGRRNGYRTNNQLNSNNDRGRRILQNRVNEEYEKSLNTLFGPAPSSRASSVGGRAGSPDSWSTVSNSIASSWTNERQFVPRPRPPRPDPEPIADPNNPDKFINVPRPRVKEQWTIPRDFYNGAAFEAAKKRDIESGALPTFYPDVWVQGQGFGDKSRDATDRNGAPYLGTNAQDDENSTTDQNAMDVIESSNTGRSMSVSSDLLGDVNRLRLSSVTPPIGGTPAPTAPDRLRFSHLDFINEPDLNPITSPLSARTFSAFGSATLENGIQASPFYIADDDSDDGTITPKVVTRAGTPEEPNYSRESTPIFSVGSIIAESEAAKAGKLYSSRQSTWSNAGNWSRETTPSFSLSSVENLWKKGTSRHGPLIDLSSGSATPVHTPIIRMASEAPEYRHSSSASSSAADEAQTRRRLRLLARGSLKFPELALDSKLNRSSFMRNGKFDPDEEPAPKIKREEEDDALEMDWFAPHDSKGKQAVGLA
ncbi:hypothetical protein RUND412_010146 [Rhizina undulata]